MARVYKLDGVELDPERVFLRYLDAEEFEAAAAADGTGSFGQVTFEDPDGTMEVRGWMPFTLDETDCTDAPRLITSWIWTRTYQRGPYSEGPGRQIVCQLLDPNALLSLRLIWDDDGQRPAETDTARLAWLLGSDYLDNPTLVQDLGLVDPPGRAFDATNYIGKYPNDVLNDLCAPRGQIYYAYWDQDAEAIGLFYDDPNSTAHTCTLTISNVDGDQSSTCLAPYIDAQMAIDPSEVYDLVRYTKTGGSIVRTNPTTRAEFFDDPLHTRGLQVENMGVGLRSTAITFANRILERDSKESIEITCTVLVPSTQVGLIGEGMRIGVRFEHFGPEGYDPLAYTRIERRQILPVEGNRELYEVALTLSTYGISGGGGTGGGSTTPFPVDPPQEASHWYSGTFTIIGDEIPGGQADTNCVLAPDTEYNFHVSVSWGPTADWGMEVALRSELSIGGVFYYPIRLTNPTDFTSVGPASFVFDGSFVSTDAAHIGSSHRFYGQSAQFPHGHDVTGTVTFWVDPVGWVTGEGQETPSPGQPFGPVLPNETPDGSTTDFTVPSPFNWAAGSLRVYVDRIDQTAAITAQDGTAGTFTLGFAPITGELVEVYGQGL